MSEPSPKSQYHTTADEEIQDAMEMLGKGYHEDRVRVAAQALVDKMLAIHADPSYITVWVLYQNMIPGGYQGPMYTDELIALAEALKL